MSPPHVGRARPVHLTWLPDEFSMRQVVGCERVMKAFETLWRTADNACSAWCTEICIAGIHLSRARVSPSFWASRARIMGPPCTIWRIPSWRRWCLRNVVRMSESLWGAISRFCMLLAAHSFGQRCMEGLMPASSARICMVALRTNDADGGEGAGYTAAALCGN